MRLYFLRGGSARYPSTVREDPSPTGASVMCTHSPKSVLVSVPCATNRASLRMFPWEAGNRNGVAMVPTGMERRHRAFLMLALRTVTNSRQPPARARPRAAPGTDKALRLGSGSRCNHTTTTCLLQGAFAPGDKSFLPPHLHTHKAETTL